MLPWPRRRLEKAARLAAGGEPVSVKRYRDLAAAYGIRVEAVQPHLRARKGGRRKPSAREQAPPAVTAKISLVSDGSAPVGPIAYKVASHAAAPLARKAWLEKVLALPVRHDEWLATHPELERSEPGPA